MVHKGFLFVGLAALCWGLSGGIGAILLADGWKPILIAFYRGAIGLLFVLSWLATHPWDHGLTSPQLWFWALLAGFGVTGNFVLYFISIAEGTVAMAATLMYCAPVFVYLISILFKLEQASAKKWIAVTMIMLGIVLLTQSYELDFQKISVTGLLAGLGAGLSYAIFIFGFKNASDHGSPSIVLLIAFLVLSGMLILPTDFQQMLAVWSHANWLLFVVLGIIGGGLSFILYVIGLTRTTPLMASILAMIEPISATLFSVLLLSEKLNSIQITGIAIILITVSILSANTKENLP